MSPKCTSWLGHSFRPRYSMPPITAEVAHKAMDRAKYSTSAVEMMEAAKGRTYVLDICVRCGHVINQSQEPSP